MELLNVLYILTGFSLILCVYAYVEEYYKRKEAEELTRAMLDFEDALFEHAVKKQVTKDEVQGIKKRTVRNIAKPKTKTTTDMIKDKAGKTKVVKRNSKGHFVK